MAGNEEGNNNSGAGMQCYADSLPRRPIKDSDEHAFEALPKQSEQLYETASCIACRLSHEPFALDISSSTASLSCAEALEFGLELDVAALC